MNALHGFMGQAKLRIKEIVQLKRIGLPSDYVQAQERVFCLPFAIALSRLTGWLLHIEWLINASSFKEATLRTPLRAYVSSDIDEVFDVSGIFASRLDFEPILERATSKRLNAIHLKSSWTTLMRVYDEQDLEVLRKLGLIIDEDAITKSINVLLAQDSYLAEIPKRSTPRIPACAAFDFVFENCAIYAQVLAEKYGLPVVELFAESLESGFTLDEPVYAHSFVLHADGSVEDPWGRFPMERLIRRYGLKTWHLKSQGHAQRLKALNAANPSGFQSNMARAKELVDALIVVRP